MAVGVIFGCVVGVICKINYFANLGFLIFATVIFIIMYFWPRTLTVGLCFVAGMVLAFLRVTAVLSSETEVQIGVDAGTEEVVKGARDWLGARIEETLPEREAGLGMSYLLGMKSGVDKKLAAELKTVGLTHIVVASGAHLMILVEIARKIFGRVSRFAGMLAATVFILFFMCMVGWTPSILRAGIMAILNLVAWYVGRKVEPLRLIVLVAAVTLMMNPAFLTELGWLLSFASYAGIMLLGPAMTKFFYGEKKPGFVASTILTTVAATVMTLPITLYYFGQMSIISVVANLLILPTLPMAMGLTFLTGVFAGVPVAGMAVATVTTKILDYHIFVVERFGAMGQFLITMERYNPRVYIIYIVILVVVVGVWGWKKRKGAMRH